MKKLLYLLLLSSFNFPLSTMLALPLMGERGEGLPSSYVNPFIGCQGEGHCFPGACLPFGLVQPSPVTNSIGWGYASSYQYLDKEIWGFSQEHLSGTGCPGLDDILMIPSTARKNRKNYHSSYDKSSETAHPGYYSVYLDQTDAKVELTCTDHVAYHRYTYYRADSAAVYVDLHDGAAWRDEMYDNRVLDCEMNWEDDHTISGHIQSSVWVEKHLYFVMTFSRPMTRMVNLPLKANQIGNKLLFFFDIPNGGILEAKVSLSSSSIDGAWKNLKAELPDWNFDATVEVADNVWNSYLSRIKVDGTDEQLTNFYTSFYHALIQPNNIADVDGFYMDAKDQIRKAPGNVMYSTFSCWDTYRATHPFYTIVTPERVDGFVSSLIEQADVIGWIPIWGLWAKDNYCMVANHGVSIVAEAYHKGFRGFDAERAFQAIKRTQTVSHQLDSYWEGYMKYGYYPARYKGMETVSTTLEAVYDDYAAWDMAKLMGKKDEVKYFARRKEFYKNLFDPETRLMRPRHEDGSWLSPFHPFAMNHDDPTCREYTEANAWQYTWHVQHDIPGLIKLIGGKKGFLDQLDKFFTTTFTDEKSLPIYGFIGQYAHGNEPSHHVAYLYTMAGRPERTQELVREICDGQYHTGADGLCGNEDCGQMSAWYIFSCMGFYPVDPVSGKYIFGAPQMKKLTLSLPGGKEFCISAENLSKENLHVAKILLNGKAYNKSYLSHRDIMNGGSLVFIMKK